MNIKVSVHSLIDNNIWCLHLIKWCVILYVATIIILHYKQHHTLLYELLVAMVTSSNMYIDVIHHDTL